MKKCIVSASQAEGCGFKSRFPLHRKQAPCNIRCGGLFSWIAFMPMNLAGRPPANRRAPPCRRRDASSTPERSPAQEGISDRRCHSF